MRYVALFALVVSFGAPALAEAQACTYSLSRLTLVVPGQGGTGTVSVTTGPACPWTAVSDRSWLTVLTPSGVGSGTITWSAVANTLPSQRIGFLTIGGVSIWVTQLPSSPGTPSPTPTPTPTPTPAAPGAPRQLAATVSGNNVTLTWSAPDTGGSPSTYVLAAGSSAGWSNLGSFPTGNTQTSFTASSIPNGTYYARVSAQNTLGASAASNEVSFTVPQACVGPAAPSGLQSTVSGLLVTLSWSAPSGGTAPASYVIEAGTAPGLANIAVVNTASTATTFAATAVPGTYYVRVRAATGCGNSAASGEVGIVVR